MFEFSFGFGKKKKVEGIKSACERATTRMSDGANETNCQGINAELLHAHVSIHPFIVIVHLICLCRTLKRKTCALN